MKRLSGKYRAVKYLGVLALLLSPVSVPLLAQTDMPWLASLKLGLWQITDRSSGKVVDKICVRDRNQLLQLRHSGPLCKRKLLRADGDEGYVYYDCGSDKGHGYTTLKTENSGLAQISSQGLFNNAPFLFNVEARYIGSCGG